MTDHSRQATEIAISFEAKKDGLQQRQSGDWMLRVTIAAVDMDQRITNAAMGTRYQCVLVEINDDETPVNRKAVERDKWRDLGATQQSALRCKDPVFWAYLRDGMHQYANVNNEETAADAVREICGIASRSDFNRLGFTEARALWHQLDNDFQGWKAHENA